MLPLHRRPAFLRALPFAAAAVVAWWAITAVRAKTGGEPCVPLDDAFIHFRYARAFAEGTPLVYSPGDPPTSGATSLLWSLVLAPFWKLGFRDTSVIWVAWAISFAALGGLALETRRLAARILPRGLAIAAGASVLAFGGHAWSAASGMEIVLFAWLLVRSARLAAEVFETSRESEAAEEPLAPIRPSTEWSVDALSADEVDPKTPAPLPRLQIELAVCGALAALARPEGALVALFAAITLAMTSARRLAVVPLGGLALTPLFFLLRTGSAVAATTQVKWLFAWPSGGARSTAASQTVQNLYVLVAQLLDGKGPAHVFLPDGFSYGVLLAPIALASAAHRRGRSFRALAVVVVALGMAIPATYDGFLANRLRYLWPFTAGVLVAMMAIGDLAAAIAARFDEKLRALRGVVAGLIVLVLLGQLPDSIEDLATSAAGVHGQQVAMARWAKSALPKDALVGVNDAGALAYLGELRTFDVVGLTTRGEARHWVSGVASRFEHYERLAREGRPLPTHLVVYPHWFEIAPVLGAQLAVKSVEGATVLGAPTLPAHEAKWSPWLGSAELPTEALVPGRGALLDTLDVADLESERDHAYELLDGSRLQQALVQHEQRLDGARSERTRERFHLELAPRGRLILRLGTTMPRAFARLRIDDGAPQNIDLGGDAWQEISLDVAPEVPAGKHRIEIDAAPGQRFLSLHYWSITP